MHPIALIYFHFVVILMISIVSPTTQAEMASCSEVFSPLEFHLNVPIKDLEHDAAVLQAIHDQEARIRAVQLPSRMFHRPDLATLIETTTTTIRRVSSRAAELIGKNPIGLSNGMVTGPVQTAFQLNHSLQMYLDWLIAFKRNLPLHGYTVRGYILSSNGPPIEPFGHQYELLPESLDDLTSSNQNQIILDELDYAISATARLYQASEDVYLILQRIAVVDSKEIRRAMSLALRAVGPFQVTTALPPATSKMLLRSTFLTQSTEYLKELQAPAP